MQIQDSARLSYRLFNENDGEELFQLDQDPLVMKYINGGQITSREDIEQRFLPRVKYFSNPDTGWGLWRVSVTQSGEFIGWVLVRPMEFFSDQPQLDDLEVGWRFMQSSWGKGHATEAAKAVCTAIVANDEVTKLSAIAMEGNVASIGIMKKLGMKFLKKALHEGPNGEEEVVFYQMAASEL